MIPVTVKDHVSFGIKRNGTPVSPNVNSTNSNNSMFMLPPVLPRLTRQLNITAPARRHIFSQLKQGFSIEETIKYVMVCKPHMCIQKIRNLVLEISNKNNFKSDLASKF